MSPTKRVALATCRDYPTLFSDDALALPELARRDIEGVPVCWEDEDVDWAGFDLVVIRSTWNYYRHEGAFTAWLNRLEQGGAKVHNPVALLRWNMDKRYLRFLAAKGVPTVPTVYLEAGQNIELAGLLRAQAWPDAVIKPTVSAGGFRTTRVHLDSVKDESAHLREILAQGGAMVQPYLPEIEAGEWSFVFLEGQFSHAVLKRPAHGEFRVQHRYGGLATLEHPDQALIAQAEKVLRTVSGPLLYARVDGVVLDGTLTVIELELLEPMLFLSYAPGAPARFAESIQARL